MIIDKVMPNEAMFRNVVRLASVWEDPEMAFDLIRQMKRFGSLPKSRMYGLALFGFLKKGMVDRTYEVDANMIESNVVAEEPELSALLKISAVLGNADKAYELLHQLRTDVKQVTKPTVGIIEDWFKSEHAAKVGKENWDVSKIKQGVVRGGGWHGQGWLGSGQWRVARTEMNKGGVSHSCGEKLHCVDLAPRETENLLSPNPSWLTKARLGLISVGSSELIEEWLQNQGPFNVVVDGINVSFVNKPTFSFNQVRLRI